MNEPALWPAPFRDMRTAVLNSYAAWASHEGTVCTPFALDAQEEAGPSFFEADIVIDDVRWTYGFELGAERVEAEWLHSYPRGRRQVWLARDASRTKVYDWPGSRVKDRSQLERRTRPNALILSTAGTDNHPQLSSLFHWFRRNLWLINPEDERVQREAFTMTELSGSRARRINELLRVADLGIEDLMKFYLAGTFGAVPSLLEGQIARRLLAANEAAALMGNVEMTC